MNKSLLSEEPFFMGKPLADWLASMGITRWSFNAIGLVNVAGHVALNGRLGELKRLPVRFGNVGGDFSCSDNQLVSLEGAPKQVGGNFYCSNNLLVSLEGAPKGVFGGFSCKCNQLVSLEGAPKQVGGKFSCNSNLLESLEGAPKQVGRSFSCSHNLLTDFKGMEGVSIGGHLLVTNRYSTTELDNVFVSMDGLPKELYSKVIGLDIPVVLELERKRAASPLGDEVKEELSSEVELG